MWGGRFNPIIPVSNGRVWDEFWSLLRYADPDVVYTYVDLADETIDRIDRFIGPELVERHRRYAPAEEPDYRPMVEETVSSAAVAPLLFRRGLTFDADVLTWHQASDWHAARWGLRNFGVWAHGVDFGSMPSNFRMLTAESSWTDVRLLTELARPYGLILPLQASASYTRFFTPRETDYEKIYTLIVGDDALTWIQFWNRVLWLSGHERSLWHTLCISTERLRDEEFRVALREFMARRVMRSGNSPPYLTITSLYAHPDELKAMVGPLFQKLDLIPVYKQTDATRAPDVSHFGARFPEFESETFGSDMGEFAHETVSGDRAFLRTPPLRSRSRAARG